MLLDLGRARTLLKRGDLRSLFIDELGWERPSQSMLVIEDRGTDHVLRGIASTKSGRADVWICISPDGTIPDYPTRLRIDARLSEKSIEHVTVFATPDMSRQSWLWVRRATKYRPRAVRTHEFRSNQTGDVLLQKLQGLFLSIETERGQAVGAEWLEEVFDTEPITKKFYSDFSKYRHKFANSIIGISDAKDRDWYASVMLNRLMFTWFIQKKRFLDNDPNYLQKRLKQVFNTLGPDNFHSFYRSFLLRLFHDGFGVPVANRTRHCADLIGNVPYLNGGLFSIHPLEETSRYGGFIQIPDSIFSDLFSFFDLYEWHLDDRPVTKGNEINPDVLGFIFEQYINQKELGAYYTRQDITDYITKSSIFPYILTSIKGMRPNEFDSEQPSSVVRYIQAQPLRYINSDVSHGCDLTLPTHIQAGINIQAHNVSQTRNNWNQLAPDDYGLPNELWRDVVSRREYYAQLRGKIVAGHISSTTDLIAHNLNIRQFLQDIIERCECPDFLSAIWKTISTINILDPTGGSGAFLFAALNILDPLYEACLDRMNLFMDSWEDNHSIEIQDHKILFSLILSEVSSHTNQRYFILKSIILKNLYAVDIMDEAVEICKLRLFLKLAAQVEADFDQPNLGIEPLPDIDFNIRAGNTIFGYATIKQYEESLITQFDFSGALDQVKTDAEHIADIFRSYRIAQNSANATQLTQTKEHLAVLFHNLNSILDRHLASRDGISDLSSSSFIAWKNKNKPFHWFVQFYDVMSTGGFNVIIGNPPYLESYQVDYRIDNFQSLSTGAIHAICMERSLQLLSESGTFSMIVPLAIVSTQRMAILQKILQNRFTVFYSNYSWRPGKLFDTVNRALTIVCCISTVNRDIYTTLYQQWFSENRKDIFNHIVYSEISNIANRLWVPKLHNDLDKNIYKNVLNQKNNLSKYVRPHGPMLYYRTSGGLYWKVFTDFEPTFTVNGFPTKNKQQASLSFQSADEVYIAISLLSSSLFWWWYVTTSNVRHLTPHNIFSFNFPCTVFQDLQLISSAKLLMYEIKRNSKKLTRQQKTTGTIITQSFVVRESKDIIDQIDYILSEHFKINKEQVDYIINFDLKFRSNLSDYE